MIYIYIYIRVRGWCARTAYLFHVRVCWGDAPRKKVIVLSCLVVLSCRIVSCCAGPSCHGLSFLVLLFCPVLSCIVVLSCVARSSCCSVLYCLIRFYIDFSLFLFVFDLKLLLVAPKPVRNCSLPPVRRQGDAPAEFPQNFRKIWGSFWDPAGVQKSTKID